MNIEWKGNQEKIHDLKNYKNGKIIVKACPGSGKTLCVSERIIKFINQHESNISGLAITSFTNVAVDEIKNNYEEETGKKIESPHFIGTLDNFINKYIFLPYGYLVMNCKKRPILVGEPHSKWHSKNYYCKQFDQISFNKNHDIYAINKRIRLTNEMKKCKEDLIKKGYATQEDANYYAMQILDEFPQITNALINKFPYLIIDEAQDLSEIQMEIVDILIKNGLKNILLVGDPYQAIFEWKTAKPQLFLYKYNLWKKQYNTNIDLKYTFRCSKNISKYLTAFCGMKIESCVDKSINLEPKLLPLDEDYIKIVDNFINKVKSYFKNRKKVDIAILFRTREDLNKYLNSSQNTFKIENILKTSDKDISEFENKLSNHLKIKNKNDIKNYTENILKGENYFLNNNFINGFREFEKAYIKIITKKFNNTNKLIHESITKKGLYNHRQDVWNFINLFEKPKNKNQLIDEWIDINNTLLLKKGKFYLSKIKTKDKYSKTNVNTILTWNMINLDNNETTSDYYCGTIHSVKGKSFDAVLLILNSACLNILGKNLMDKKELRNVYVGMSRARHILNIAVPQNDLEIWESFFQNKIKQTSLDNFF